MSCSRFLLNLARYACLVKKSWFCFRRVKTSTRAR
uniref:Uncharacterized protein n=1 Tax=Arundo donax TaxID=35708 RepID=A0A0A9FNG2_ARUDO